MEEQVLFVFYTLGENAKNWKYDNFPKGWSWTGCGSTSAIGEPFKEYQREEQFNGPSESAEQMIDYLEAYFIGLLDDKVITKFK